MTRKQLQAHRKKRNDKIVALYGKGLTLDQVGAKVGLTGTACMFVLQSRGITRRGCWDYEHARIPGYLRAQAKIRQFANLYGLGQGYTIGKLAKKVGYCTQTVSKHLREAGIKLRPGAWPTKLTEEKVRQIKADLIAEVLSFTELAAKYRISRGLISNIATGRKWKSIPWPNKTGYKRRGQGRRPLGQSMGGAVLKRPRRGVHRKRK